MSENKFGFKPVLTEEEYAALVKGEGDKELRLRAERKLNTFQRTKVSGKHVSEINSYIPVALKHAERIISKTKYIGDDKISHDNLFHQAMDNLTKKAGLRV